MRRYLPRLLLTGALLSPATLYALGLGEIRLNSALNQPFDAEIELIAPTTEELQSLKIGLASNELFSRYGLDRPAFLSNFDFSVARTREGRATIKVSSNRSVTEPFVTLLIEASWARGRLLREYTVLLDPPVFMPAQPQAAPPIAAPQSGARTEGRIERAPTPAPEPTPVSPPAPSERAPQPAAAPAPARQEAAPTIDGSYTVQRNDTLYRIANRMNPGPPAVVNRTMIALFRANPAAFSGNINRLRAGSVLRAPELADVDAISSGEASAEVARQTQEWSSATSRTAAETETSRLRLVTPAETPAAPAPAPATASPTRPAPGAAAGTPAPATPAPGDRRLQVESPGLAGVQQNKAPTPTPVQPAAPAAEPPAATAPEPEAPVAEPPAAAPPKAPAPVTPTPSAAEGPSVFERIGEFWWVPVIVGLLVVLALIMAFLRRRRDAEALSDTFASAPPMEYDPVTARTSGRAGAHAFDISESDQDETAFAEPEPLPAASRPRTRPVAEPSFAVAAEDTLSSESAVRFDQQDALAEADFHMAYGLYDQAADLVKIAIDREPARRDLKLKLLEIYFVWGNKDLFLDTARKLHATREGSVAGEWDKVVIMGKQIAPEDAMFKGDAGAAHVDLVDVNLEGGENRVDVDLFAEPEPGSTSEGLDLEFTTGEHKFSANADAGDLDMLLEEPEAASDEEPTREMDPLARTQETPTIESPQLDRSPTVRERLEKSAFTKNGVDQTAELSLDDLGFDTDSLEATGSLEDTSSLEKDLGATEIAPRYTERTAADRALADDEMTQLAPSLSSFDRTLEAPRVEKYDIESTGTIYIDQVDLAGGGDTVEQPRPDVDSTASMQRPTIAEHTLSDGLDLDLDHLSGPAADGDTLRHVRDDNTEIDRFTTDVFADSDDASDIDLDVGDALGLDDHAPTNKQVITTEMELSELEPVTMSEVGTKLDLARAYMDMGDPDGARSILEEVLQEGTPNQKQEAQRLLESIR